MGFYCSLACQLGKQRHLLSWTVHEQECAVTVPQDKSERWPLGKAGGGGRGGDQVQSKVKNGGFQGWKWKLENDTDDISDH